MRRDRPRSGASLRLTFAWALISLWLTNGVQPALGASPAPSILGWAPSLTRGIAPTSPLTIYFDRAMDRNSVEGAWRISPAVSGRFSWHGNALTFVPQTAYRPGAYYRLTIADARAATGGSLAHPFTLAFSTSDVLKVQSYSPSSGTKSVPPNGLIAATFTQPMVALAGVGAGANPPGWHATISPATPGKGTWLGTSTWVFRADRGLQPSTRYTVTISGGSRDAWGQSLGKFLRWSFRTVTPEVVARVPSKDAYFANPRGPISVSFNQAMRHAATARAFVVRSSHGRVTGTISWKNNTLRFLPAGMLPAHIKYTVSLSGQARSANNKAVLGKSMKWSFYAAPSPHLVSTNPRAGHSTFATQIEFLFNTPMDKRSLDARLKISPKVSGIDTELWGPNQNHTFVYAVFAQYKPSTAYTISLSEGATDQFGRTMSGSLSLPFTTARIAPAVALYGMPSSGQVISLASGRIAAVPIQTINVPRAHYVLKKTNVQGLASAISGNTSVMTSPVRQWSTTVPDPLNKIQNQTVHLKTRSGTPLSPGIYILTASSDTDLAGMRPGTPDPVESMELVVVQNASVTVKQSGRSGLVWVTLAQTGRVWANAPVTLIDGMGNRVASGHTDTRGIYTFHLSKDIGGVGALVKDSAHLGVTQGWWTASVQPDADLPPASEPHGEYPYVPFPNGTYLYTDRPVYRPGQQVHYRAIIWRDRDAIYSHYGPVPVSIQASSSIGKTVYYKRSKLDGFGAVSGSFSLPAGAATGSYQIYVNGKGLPGLSTRFSVAEYRKPDFLATASTDRPSYVQGETAGITFHVDYVFGAPVANQHVAWTAYAQARFDQPPGWDAYTFVDWEKYWQHVTQPNGQQGTFGVAIAQGAGTTDGHGALTVHLPIALAKDLVDQTITVEGTTTDINGQSVSARAQFPAHKAAIAIGLDPAHRVVPTGQPTTVSMAAVQQNGSALPNQQLGVKVFHRTYASKLTKAGGGTTAWQSVPRDTLITTETLTTGSDGKAVISFTPGAGGDYYIDVTGRDALGNQQQSAITISANSEGASDWGAVDSPEIALRADKTSYRVGETAHLVLQAPFNHATALVTEERGTIRSKKVLTLGSNSPTIDIPIVAGDIPNIYVTVTIYRGWRDGSPPDWRDGATDIHVALDPRDVVVKISPDSTHHLPGQKAMYIVTTTDTAGHGISAQLSLALVDTSVLALEQEVNADIVQALYGDRPLGVSTASEGTISIDHLHAQPAFLVGPRGYGFDGVRNGVEAAPTARPVTGGGGGGNASVPPGITVRSRFADTAYWAGAVRTNSAGVATVKLPLPDNTTTWRMDARAITTNGKVGDGKAETLVTQDIILRPALPRFLLEGDSLQVGTVVNNTLGHAVHVDVSIRASGVSVSGSAGQGVTVPAEDEKILLWPARVAVGSAASFTFTARSADPTARGDAVTVGVPVHPPLTDETTATSGQVFDATKQYIIVPKNAVPQPGALTVRVSSALTAGLGASYSQFKPHSQESNEEIADRLLVAASLRALPFPLTGITSRQYVGLSFVVNSAAQKLIGNQLGEGGWPWYNDAFAPSDPSITATVVQALTLAGRRNGVGLALRRGRLYLQQSIVQVQPAERSDLMLALARSGGVSRSSVEGFYNDSIHRSHLDIAPLAELGWSLASIGDHAKAQSIVAAIDSRAVASATGAHWEGSAWNFWSLSAIDTTIEVLGAELTLSPHDPFVPAAVRWLMLSRQGAGWDCGPTTAQAIAVLARYARASREGTADYSYLVTVGKHRMLAGSYAPRGKIFSSTRTMAIRGLARGRASTLSLLRQPRGGVLGQGPFYYVADLHYYLPAANIRPLDEGISVHRWYTNLKGMPITSAPVGSAVKVHLTIHSASTLVYLDVEDPLPSGLEPIDESLETSQQGIGRRPYGWWDYSTGDLAPYLSHTDLRDNRVSLYASYLPPGSFAYTYLAAATVPGTFGAAPTHASETFFPEVFGRSGGTTFKVR